MGPQKQTYSSPYTVAFDEQSGQNFSGNEALVISGSGREVSFLKLSTGQGAAFVTLYDAKDVASTKKGDRKWVMDAGTGTPDINVFPNPLTFKKGIVAVLEQGIGANSILSIAFIGDLP